MPIDSSWVDEGTSLGSNDVQALKAPKVLLVWDTPTSTLSAGWTRYTLERRFGQDVTAVRTSSLGRANFNDYDVIVMPSGNFAGTINDGVLNRIKDWLRSGGTLVTMAEATRWATGVQCRAAGDDRPAERRSADVPPPQVPVPQVPRVPQVRGAEAGRAFDYDKAIQPDRERPASQPGAILRVDARHQSLADRRQRRRDAGDDRRQPRVRAAQAEQRPQRRHLRAPRTS